MTDVKIQGNGKVGSEIKEGKTDWNVNNEEQMVDNKFVTPSHQLTMTKTIS